jgi:hypothetical protein
LISKFMSCAVVCLLKAFASPFVLQGSRSFSRVLFLWFQARR